MIKPPSFPKVNLLTPDGLFISSPGYKVGEQVNAISAWQNTLKPARPKIASDKEKIRKGRDVFFQAQCHTCHAGEAYTNHCIIDAKVIGTEPSRAKALKATEKIFGETSIYSFDMPVPIPKKANIVQVPTGHLDPEQLKLAFAHGNSAGGYKVKGLMGLYWTAPYLHDGGVAVGPDPTKHLGIPGTSMRGIEPDPFNSLKALVDRQLRQKVIAANRSSKQLQSRVLKNPALIHISFCWYLNIISRQLSCMMKYCNNLYLVIFISIYYSVVFINFLINGSIINNSSIL